MSKKVCYDPAEETGLVTRQGSAFPNLLEGGWDYDLSPSFDPRWEVRESDDALRLIIEVPGVKKDAIHVDVGDGVLNLRGERKAPEGSEEACCCCSQLAYGLFEKSFNLPDYADGAKVEAHYQDGMLELRIPKKEESRRKAIEVKID